MRIPRFRIRTLMIAVAVVGTGFAIPWRDVFPYVEGVVIVATVGLAYLLAIGLTALVLSPFLWTLLWLLDRGVSAYRYRDQDRNH